MLARLDEAGAPAHLQPVFDTSATPRFAGRAALGLARHYTFRGDHGAAAPYLERAWELATAGPDPRLAHDILQSQLCTAVYRADAEQGRRCVEQLLAHRRTHGLEHLPHQNIAVWYDLVGDLATMEALLDADIVSYRTLGERTKEANAWMNKGYLQMQRMAPEAESTLRRAVDLAQRAGNRLVECTSRFNLCYYLFAAHRFTPAQAEGLAALALAEALSNDRQVAMASLALAQVAAARCSPDALERLERAVTMGAACGDLAVQSFAGMLLAPLLWEAGETARAQWVWDQMLEGYARGPKTERFRVSLEIHRALFAWCRGDPGPTVTFLEEHPDGAAAGCLRAWTSRRRPGGG